MKEDSNFLIITSDEIILKLKAYIRSEQEIDFWQPEKEHEFIKCYHARLNERGILLDKIVLTNEGKVFATFVYNHCRYFMKGETLEDESIQFEEFFKHEKRTKERILSYPHREIYFQIPFGQKKGEDNLLFLNKEKNEIKQDELVALKEKLDGEKSVLEFRVLDISEKGCSILTNSEEKEYFESSDNFKNIEIFHEKKKIIRCEQVKIKYVINFVSEKFKHVPMFKVGMEYTKFELLDNSLFIDDENESELCEEFEKNC